MSCYGPLRLRDFGREPGEGACIVHVDGSEAWRHSVVKPGAYALRGFDGWDRTGSSSGYSWQSVLEKFGHKWVWILTPEVDGADDPPCTTAGSIRCERCGELIPLPVEIVSNDAAGIVANITTDDLELHQLTHECEL